MPWRPDHLVCGVSYQPAEVGPYLWHEFDAERTRRDLRRIRAAGFPAVRVPLAWDAFVPTPRQVSRYRLRDLELLLQAAHAHSLQVVPVLFAQSWGDCVLLPRYAVHRDRPRPGVRVVCDGIVERGGPRDVWDDPLMLEVEAMWLDELLRGFANHPAVLAWDLGHDPASTCRPRRIAHLARWAELMGSRVRATQDPCWLTLGALDVLTARGVRLAAVAPHVDALGMLVHPQRLPLQGDALDVARVLFVLRLAQRLVAPDGDNGAAGAATPVHLVAGLVAQPVQPIDAAPASGVRADAMARPRIDVAAADAVAAARHAGALLERLPGAGCAAAFTAAWCDLGARTLAAAPFDRDAWLARCGIAEAGGELKPHGAEWAAVARRDVAAEAAAPWPAAPFDVAQWYENSPDASNDLFARFHAEFGLAG